jgi:hypothetical protein
MAGIHPTPPILEQKMDGGFGAPPVRCAASTPSRSSSTAAMNCAMDRARNFFIKLQQSERDWLSLGTTKTGLVYRLEGNPPQAHE